MISARTLVASAITAVFTGAVGFISASFLQHQASQEQIAQLTAAHQLEMERIEQATLAAQERDRDLVSQGLYQTWMSEPLTTQATLARETLDAHPLQNYAQVLSNQDVTEEQRAALRAVVNFWVQVDDLANDNALNMERVTQRLGPVALGWQPYLEGLVSGLDGNPAHNAAIYALEGARTVADLERAQGRNRDPRVARARPPRPTSSPP